jgi:hypothetical protein
MRAPLMLAIVIVVAVITAACGDSKSSLLPTAPSGLAAEAPNVDAGATVAGTMGNGPKPGNGNGNGGGNSPAPATTETETIKVDFEGIIDAVDLVANTITVSGQLVHVTGGTVIRHGDRFFQFPALRRGDRVHVTGDRVGTTVTATEIKLQNPGDVVVPTPDPDPVVTVTASDATAMEGADTATFRLSRTGTQTQLGASLSVAFTLNGTASAADYTLAPLTASFGANQETVDLTVTPANDGLAESPETLILTVNPGLGYLVGSSASATVTINDPPDPDQVVSVTAADAIAYETTPTGVDTGAFQLTRSATERQLANPLTVSFTMGGAASNGSDYDLPLTATFAANSATANVTLTPLDDGVTESPEWAALTLVAGAGYQVGSPSVAGVTIADAPPPQVSISVADSDAHEFGNTGRYVVSRSGNLSASLIVTLRWGGSATFGTFAAGGDYLVSGADNNVVNPTTLTFAEGVSAMEITVEPFREPNGAEELQETIELTVADGETYDLGPIFSGIVFIAANR